MITKRLPWQEAQWSRVERMRASGRLPHALMLRGVEGLGKRAFADRLAATLLCEGDDPPCEQCRGCRLFGSGAHPDFLRVQPEEEQRGILIHQIRGFIDHLALTTTYGGYKVVILEPAEAMNRSAVNTLLKTLEEPPGAVVVILVSHRSGALPATIRSRCQMLEFPVPGPGQVRPWLEAQLKGTLPADVLLRLAGGMPFRALAMAEAESIKLSETLVQDLANLAGDRADPIAVAALWRKHGAADVGAWLSSLTSDLIRLKSDTECATLTHTELRETMQLVARQLDLRSLFGLLDRVFELRWLFLKQTNVNEQLLLEDLAVRWASAGQR